MPYFCWSCGNEMVFEVKVGVKVGRQDQCPHCRADMHVCKNCVLYDPGLHNQCREPEASFIRDREAGNFCPHFDFRQQDEYQPAASTAAAKAKLDALFKKLK